MPALRLLQLTDTHLFADPGGRLLGQNTRRTFELALEQARENFWPVDRILLTGDLVHDESVDGYRFLAQRLTDLGVPCSCVPGNHDTVEPMKAIFSSGIVSIESSVVCGAWNLVFIDSTVPGQDGGHLDSVQLTLLEQSLASQPERHTLVCMHHAPVPVGSAWMDTMVIDNASTFFSVLDRHPQVRGALWGHVHQDFTSRRKDLLLLAAPSTCIQFLPGSEDFTLDSLTPGFRWLELQPDGRIDTGIQRIASYPDPIDFTTGGY